MRYKVPAYAKKAAKQALEERKNLPRSRQYGLDKKEAGKQGINSGVERARQLKSSNTISERDARRIAAFYDRFKNCRTPKCEGAIKLWGGRRYGRSLAEQLD